jgi:ubiquinone/menaquinone biosynthesis C-methylase UbiE
MSESPWNRPATVEGFVRSPPNGDLMAVTSREFRAGARLLDIGCGAGRNACPLATAGWDVVGTDSSLPMLTAASRRDVDSRLGGRVRLIRGAMDQLPLASETFDVIVAHGIWNLARSGHEFRTAISEAARVARPRSALFVFTFSRATIEESARPLAGESFVFTEFSGQPQCFLTQAQLVNELALHGFEVDPSFPLRELNRPVGRSLPTNSGPVIFQGLFRCLR